jgi:hypothetical protein
MGTPAEAVRLFHSPGVLEADPLPPNAMEKTNVEAKGVACKSVLIADVLGELRGIADSLQDDEWTFETGEEKLLRPR